MGCLISISTRKDAVIRIIKPIVIDFVTAAEMKPTTNSRYETGADKSSLIDPMNFGKYIEKDAFDILCRQTVSNIKPGPIKLP